jgi:hypothetical protein
VALRAAGAAGATIFCHGARATRWPKNFRKNISAERAFLGMTALRSERATRKNAEPREQSYFRAESKPKKELRPL